MIDLHYWPTPNGKKVTILLEECGLPYRIVSCSHNPAFQSSPDCCFGDDVRDRHASSLAVDRLPASRKRWPSAAASPLAKDSA